MSVSIQDDTLYQQVQDDLDRQGFAKIERITDDADVHSILARMKQMLTENEVKSAWLRDLGDTADVSDQTQILEINGPTNIAPELLQSRFFQQAQRVSQDILGPNAELIFDHCIIKPPKSEVVTAWHQDGAYARKFTFLSGRLHWWLPLQPVDNENGCMQFVAGSHLGPILPHHLRTPKAHALETEPPPADTVTACPLPIGGATIHLIKTLHFTGANYSDAPRYAWVVQFGIKSWMPRIAK